MGSSPSEEHFHAWVGRISSHDNWDALSESERTILLAYELELEVSNGGLHQYFKNPAGDRWPETVESLNRIGATRILDIFEKALSAFPHQSPSTDHDTRAAQLDRLGPAGEERLEELTEAYFAIYHQHPEDDSYARMLRFLQEEGQLPGDGRD